MTTTQSGLAADVPYLLRIGDTCLILAQRIGEWCGHAPILEEDIALTNMALDLVGQARALLTHAGRVEGRGRDEDQLAFLRDERDYLNLTMVELPRGDFAFTVLRNLMIATLLKLLWQRLLESHDSELAGIAGRAVKEASYHQQHAADWVVRLGDGSAESRQRSESALRQLWPYTAEFFAADALDERAAADGIGPSWSELAAPWRGELLPVLDEAMLVPPADTAFRSAGKSGRHSEHMGFILTTMQHLQRAYPGGCVVIAASVVAPVGPDVRADVNEPGAVFAHAWAVLATVLDPEVPALSVCDLGIVRDVLLDPDGSLHIVLTPTYSGCPATEAIERDVLAALLAAGLGAARVSLRRAPAWTTDWISEEGRSKLFAYGIAPPGPVAEGGAVPMRFVRRGEARAAAPLTCPQCGSRDSERLSAFGSTACKALYRCRACREPFEHFKPI